jgi:hypothetical protein
MDQPAMKDGPGTEHKNVFAIARRGSSDNEDQLTELLAYLIQEEPIVADHLLADFGYKATMISSRTQQSVLGGRLDLKLEAPQACVVVESKLGSTTDFAQCAKYIEHLAAKPISGRSLVLLTKFAEPWPEGVQEFAAERSVELVARRWWDVTKLLRQTHTALASDFAQMLEDEGLVVPGPLKDADWDSSEIPPAAMALLTELKPKVQTLSSGFRRQILTRGRHSSYRSAYSLAYFDSAQIGPGLAAGWNDLVSHRRLSSLLTPLDGPIFACSVLNPCLKEAEQPAAALKAVELGGDDVVGACWGKFPTRAALAASVLTSNDFLGQVEQALEYTRATVQHFREIGYLTDLAMPAAT